MSERASDSGTVDMTERGSALDKIIHSVGPDAIILDPVERAFYAHDVFKGGPEPIAVFRPTDKDMLARGIGAATNAGIAIIPRGGGMSYTGGYVASTAGALLVDTSQMCRVLDLNIEDMTATVEAGCTWDALRRALKPHGLRALVWGPISGVNATIGGGMSQNGMCWGSRDGTLVDAALKFEVVLADGAIVSTGNAFFRPFGPDVTGLFASDCGALGVKATVTLRLVREGCGFAYGSFAFPDYKSFFGGMSAIAREGLASEIFGLDPYQQQQSMNRDSLSANAKSLVKMMQAQGSSWKALKEGARVVAAGRSFLNDVPFSLHIVCEARNQASADADLREADAIAVRHGGRAVENSIPKMMRANPFPPVNSMVGPEGERWVPVFGFLAHSRLLEAWERIQALFTANAGEMNAQGVRYGVIFAGVGPQTCMIEPTFYWPDALEALHVRSLEPDHLAKLHRYPANPQAHALVERLRNELIDIYRALDATTLAVARTYPLRQVSDRRAWEVLRAVKRAVDPRNLMNPGSLDLSG